MPGIPRSQRCAGCRHRKIKCDQNWPTCTPCLKKDIACSGPSTTAKFVHSNHNDAPASLAVASDFSSYSQHGHAPRAKWPALGWTESIPKYSMVDVNSRRLDGGASYSCFRLSSGPRSVPTTVADRVAIRLSALLDKGIYDNGVFNMRYMTLIPQRLSQSAALRDCVALLCSAWANSRRKMPVDELVALGIYGKALRSLQRALSGPQALACETLAAVTIMERFFIIFNRGNRASRMLHIQGIRTLMQQRGPPTAADDELVQFLTLENQGCMFAHSVLTGDSNLYTDPAWNDALTHSRELLRDDSLQLPDAAAVNSCFTHWPNLVRDLQSLHADTTNEVCLAVRVKQLCEKIKNLEAEVKLVMPYSIARMESLGLVIEMDCHENPTGKRFAVQHLDYAELRMACVTFPIILNRMQHELWTYFGDYLDDEIKAYLPNIPTLQAESRECSHQIAKCVPYLREIGPLVGGLLTTPIHLSIENADPDVKKYMIDYMLDVNKTQNVFPSNTVDWETFLIDRARLLVGRRVMGSGYASPRETPE